MTKKIYVKCKMTFSKLLTGKSFVIQVLKGKGFVDLFLAFLSAISVMNIKE